MNMTFLRAPALLLPGAVIAAMYIHTYRPRYIQSICTALVYHAVSTCTAKRKEEAGLCEWCVLFLTWCGWGYLFQQNWK
ncbi:hypothetical protein B0T26DRAFT_44996 [Lasiosphaeria miniovina]|uniref:Uncharacterized protein n=1 Tax=Lasiosphaeria miniovina TaxID=1954250 RepID=A0AA40EBI1_9PEZI|nr:uncharacterized protein B0T26DRAFT_44996 [Lasiosphaeria miniovina]KAK0733925.1 hypothetical protein B0T26DRAFT_44996 [Lasiosphaeria miniovina]